MKNQPNFEPFIKRKTKLSTKEKRRTGPWCIKKFRYWTQRDAARACKRNRESSGKNLRIYRCPECRQWHLTSQ